jgi:hypothetical protein
LSHKADWDAATVARLGRDWYQHEYPREYGITLSTDGFLQVFLGAQTHSSDTTQSWSCFLPFTQWRHVRYSLYDLQGDHFWTEPDGMPWDERQANVDACPSITFAFEDFDGERIEATTKIEEREWRFGDKQFKWLSMFRKPKISRCLDINFSKETGPKKGSWKGGTVGHGMEILPGELHESAFRRYCAEHKMNFLGLVPVSKVKVGYMGNINGLGCDPDVP